MPNVCPTPSSRSRWNRYSVRFMRPPSRVLEKDRRTAELLKVPHACRPGRVVQGTDGTGGVQLHPREGLDPQGDPLGLPLQGARDLPDPGDVPPRVTAGQRQGVLAVGAEGHGPTEDRVQPRW